MKLIKKYVPGLLILVLIALFSTCISKFLPSYIGKVFIAIVTGIIIANVFHPNKEIFGSGIKLGLGRFLKIGIVLMGAGISFKEIAALGGKGLIVIVLLTGFVFGLTFLLGRTMNVSLRKKILIAVGVSICGNSAIVATAPLVDAEDEEVAMAVGIVTLFGVLGVLLYPMLGMALGMNDMLFGTWAGTAINDTSQVVAAGFIFSESAGKIATTIKLTRNIMIVPVILLVAFFYRKNINKDAQAKVNIIKIFPTFILGFLVLAFLNSIGLLMPEISSRLVDISKFLMLLALSGIGLGVDFKKIRTIGIKPFILGFSVEALLAVVAVLLNRIVFL